MPHYDLSVIGGGTAGYSAAIRAAELGLKVALVEKDAIGGTCLNRGCIPTKALLHAAELLEEARSAPDFGITFGDPSVDWAKTQSAKEEVVSKLVRGLGGLLERRNIEIVRGFARLDSPGVLSIAADGQDLELRSDAVVVATGSAPRIFPEIPIDEERIMTSDGLLGIRSIPRSLAILGGGFIGCEFASLFNAFGCEVTIIEVFPELLAKEDREIKERIAPAFVKRGIRLRLGATVANVARNDDSVRVELSEGEPVESERLLIAVGRRPVADGLNLEAAGAALDGGYVVVDEDYEAAPGLYAIGDCIPTLPLAHAAFAEGYYVAERIAGRRTPRPNYDGIPRVAYCSPEVAAVGLTEEQAVSRGLDFTIARFPFRANSRAVAMKGGEGFAKILALKDGGPIIGVHLIGARVSELIAEAMLAVNWEASAAELGMLHHPHPTLSEAIGEAALKLAGMPLHSP
ncbi:MAG: dihydrolipoyl dehydrogenase [Candidatus Aquicultorales bacterium]